jgi:hypothetical protein
MLWFCQPQHVEQKCQATNIWPHYANLYKSSSKMCYAMCWWRCSCVEVCLLDFNKKHFQFVKASTPWRSLGRSVLNSPPKWRQFSRLSIVMCQISLFCMIALTITRIYPNKVFYHWYQNPHCVKWYVEEIYYVGCH